MTSWCWLSRWHPCLQKCCSHLGHCSSFMYGACSSALMVVFSTPDALFTTRSVCMLVSALPLPSA